MFKKTLLAVAVLSCSVAAFAATSKAGVVTVANDNNSKCNLVWALHGGTVSTIEPNTTATQALTTSTIHFDGSSKTCAGSGIGISNGQTCTIKFTNSDGEKIGNDIPANGYGTLASPLYGKVINMNCQ